MALVSEVKGPAFYYRRGGQISGETCAANPRELLVKSTGFCELQNKLSLLEMLKETFIGNVRS